MEEAYFIEAEGYTRNEESQEYGTGYIIAIVPSDSMLSLYLS